MEEISRPLADRRQNRLVLACRVSVRMVNACRNGPGIAQVAISARFCLDGNAAGAETDG